MDVPEKAPATTGAQRVGVLTFHRCVNYGSYWQARAIAEGLARRGLRCVLLDHRSPAAERAEARNVFQPVLPVRTSRADYRSYATKARRFARAIEALPRSRSFAQDCPSDMEPLDVVVVGSDEVWNFRHPWYAACPLFFGEGLRAERVVSYAASFGCHDAAERLGEPWAGRLRRFSALSVRDDNSRRLIQEGLGLEPALTLDPCLQFADVCRGTAETDTRLAVVYGHGFSPGVVAATRRWAAARKVRLVSVGYRNDWADEQRLDACPEEFSRLIGCARAVVTNFFHGCVFAMLNEKPFACDVTPYRWQKVSSLLRQLGVDDRLLKEQAEDRLPRLLDEPPGERVRARIAELRARSSDFLDHALA